MGEPQAAECGTDHEIAVVEQDPSVDRNHEILVVFRELPAINHAAAFL
jgi:hypothetical protein